MHPTHVRQLAALIGHARAYPRGVTRTDLIDLLDLGRNAVDRRLDAALAVGLLTHSGKADSTGGRAPENWAFNPRAGSVLALQLSYRHSVAALLDLTGTVIDQGTLPVGFLAGPPGALNAALPALKELRERADAERLPSPWGLGVSIALPVDFRDGSILSSHTHDVEVAAWPGFALRQQLTRALGLPVWVDDEVNALATSAAGRTGAPKDILVVRLSVGIGLGLVVDSHVHRGSGGGSAELSHIPVAVVGLGHLVTDRLLAPENLIRWLPAGSSTAAPEMLTLRRQDA
ncbi:MULTISPECIES: ROK family protein [unclassified Actinomyces]|uniref:ROK family protein n=1 Tax=unclassified Actinomyces TaxID=2609248 RepID=UPI002018007F|nr:MULTISPECIES: ROK family protein [unclassified Actinomyces]MCL3777443.1 ROK family protein [Actinomyces sp. AC-20-1]MCL3789740.1 ROK family protein [Actinomyces sp. 187325]MCL3792122.1 ROK family protein [Actinomyces sp. 186855]MCL3794794.1 ROK family protein [Actinomyces sp. 217892]